MSNTPYFTCKHQEDGTCTTSHNLNGNLGFSVENTVDEDTYRLLLLAIDEGKRIRSREIKALLEN
jgi:hypothetical protein